MDEQELQFPLRGIDQSRAFVRQTGETTPTAVNVRAFDELEDRRRGGSRNGLARWLDDAVVAGSKIQGLGCVVSMGEEFLAGYYPFAWPGFATDPVTLGPIRPGGSGEPSLPRKVPILTWVPSTSLLFEDEAFAVGHLDAAATNPVDSTVLAGTFSYDPPVGTVFGHTSQRDVVVTFTPTDTTNFRKAQATHTFKRKKTPTYVDWTVTTPVADATVLDGSILNAIGRNKDTAAVVPGTVTYDLWYFDGDGNRVNLTASGAVLSNAESATYYLNAFFTPDNSTRFETSKLEVVVTVNPPSPGGPPYTFTARDLFYSSFVFNLVPSTVDVRDSGGSIVNTVTFSAIKANLFAFLQAGGYDGFLGNTWPGPVVVTVADYTAIDGGGIGTWAFVYP